MSILRTAENYFSEMANTVAQVAGRPITFLICVIVVLAWGLTGPLFGFGETWQLFINTATTIITFLMVFLIQNTQNRDMVAFQTKLDELIRVCEAENRFIGIEHLTESDVEKVRRKLEQKVAMTPDANQTTEKRQSVVS
jgi:low affinity Fe/Cu permease